MKILSFVVILFAGLSVNAAYMKEFNGKKYYLSYDFDTADGACVLNGFQYATMFYATQEQTSPVALLNADGTVKSLIDSGTQSYQIIEELQCE